MLQNLRDLQELNKNLNHNNISLKQHSPVNGTSTENNKPIYRSRSPGQIIASLVSRKDNRPTLTVAKEIVEGYRKKGLTYDDKNCVMFMEDLIGQIFDFKGEIPDSVRDQIYINHPDKFTAEEAGANKQRLFAEAVKNDEPEIQGAPRALVDLGVAEPISPDGSMLVSDLRLLQGENIIIQEWLNGKGHTYVAEIRGDKLYAFGTHHNNGEPGGMGVHPDFIDINNPPEGLTIYAARLKDDNQPVEDWKKSLRQLLPGQNQL